MQNIEKVFIAYKAFYLWPKVWKGIKKILMVFVFNIWSINDQWYTYFFITTQYCHIFSANSDNGNDNSDGCVIFEEVLWFQGTFTSSPSPHIETMFVFI